MSILNIFSKTENATLKYKTTVFMVCLAISTAVWTFIKLSDEYNTEIIIPVRYSQIPEGKILVNKVDTTLKIGITDQGFALTWLKYFTKKVPLNVDLSDYRLHQHMHEYEALVNTQSWEQSFLNQYDLRGRVTYILPDTLTFFFEDRYSKEVPVKPDLNISFKKQFFAYDSLFVTPDKVTISGLNKTISAITEIKTSSDGFADIGTSIDRMVKLLKPEGADDITIEPQEVNVKLDVEKYTESSMNIKIEMTNQPEHLRVKIFPETLTVRYLIALKDFKKVNPDMFRCKVNLRHISKESTKKLAVTLTNYPQFVKIIKTEPAEVDYLILK